MVCRVSEIFSDMGNKSENEITNDDKQDSFYHLVNLNGEGILVALANQARHTQNYAELDKIIKCKIGPFLYEKGNGKQLPVSELVRYRSRSRQFPDPNLNSML